RWLEEDHKTFIRGLEMYGKKWKLIRELLPGKTLSQIRTHAYGYFAKLLRNSSTSPDAGEW
ncbi:unnamed protein product, partial [Discosporangium mesarthrocarpum]